MADVSPVSFIFFLALALIPTGPYIWRETDWKKSGIALTLLGFGGTIGVGIAIFWRLLPNAFFTPRIPAFIAFLAVTLGLVITVTAILLNDRDKRTLIVFRDMGFVCGALWFAVRFILPVVSAQLVPSAATDATMQIPSPVPSVAPSVAPTPTWVDQLAHGRGPAGAASYMLHEVNSPGIHTIEIVAAQESHSVAESVANIFRSEHWSLVPHGGLGTDIGSPNQYVLADGFTVRGKADSVDTQTVQCLLEGIGFHVGRYFLPPNDPRNYPILEIGGMSDPQRFIWNRGY